MDTFPVLWIVWQGTQAKQMFRSFLYISMSKDCWNFCLFVCLFVWKGIDLSKNFFCKNWRFTFFTPMFMKLNVPGKQADACLPEYCFKWKYFNKSKLTVNHESKRLNVDPKSLAKTLFLSELLRGCCKGQMSAWFGSFKSKHMWGCLVH